MSDAGESTEAGDGTPAVTEGDVSAGNADWTRGVQVWIVLGALLLAFLIAPWALILFPTVQNSVRMFGLSFRDAYLIVPLIPAIGLGALGVWTALKSRRGN